MALPDLTGQNIENTYQRILQTDGTFIYDGTGSIIDLPTGSFVTTSSFNAFTGSHNTGSFATTGSNTFIGNQTLSGSLTVSGSITGNLPGSFGASFDGMGSVVLVNSRTFFTAPRAGTITGWNVIADGTFPTFSLDVWSTGSASNSLPTSASSILGGSFVGISGSATNYTSSNNLTAWTSSFAANDIFAINVVSCSVATRINLSLQVIYTT